MRAYQELVVLQVVRTIELFYDWLVQGKKQLAKLTVNGYILVLLKNSPPPPPIRILSQPGELCCFLTVLETLTFN